MRCQIFSLILLHLSAYLGSSDGLLKMFKGLDRMDVVHSIHLKMSSRSYKFEINLKLSIQYILDTIIPFIFIQMSLQYEFTRDEFKMNFVIWDVLYSIRYLVRIIITYRILVYFDYKYIGKLQEPILKKIQFNPEI